jgi:glycosyltransferase involved in cell wall biosynthesis
VKINILQGAFLPVPPIKGGAIEAVWFLLGQEFAKHGHEVTHISCIHKDLKKTETIAGVNHLRIRGSKAVKNPWLLKALELPYVLRARKVMSRADILVTHAFWAPLILPRKAFGKQYVHVGRYPKGQLRFYKKASRLQVPSTAIKDICLEQAPSLSSKIKTLPYPLTWPIPPKEGFEEKDKTVLYAGRIHPEKGVLSLCETWNRLPKEIAAGWNLRLVGPWREGEGGGGNSFKEKLVQTIKQGSNQIALCEPIFDRSKLKEVMMRASYFVYPSMAKRGETFGLSVLEAMSCGCVPVVSSLGCFQDFINHEVEGFIFKKTAGKTMSGLGNTLTHALQLNQSEFTEFSRAAWARSEDFSLEKVALGYLNDFNEIL